jgi:hypothetical protein
MRCATVWGLVLVFAAVCSTGCPGKGDARSGSGPDAATKAAKAPKPRADDGVPEGFIDPLTASQKIHDPVKFTKKLSQVAQDLDPNDAPEYAKKMIDHLKKVAALIDENLKDCDHVQDALEAYFEKNKEEIVRLHKEGTEKEAAMDETERAKVQTLTMLLMGPIAESLAKTLAQFQMKCPDQAQAVADLLQTVVGT